MIFLRISKFYHALYQRVSFVLLLLKVVSGISASHFFLLSWGFFHMPPFPPCAPLPTCHFFSWDDLLKNALFQTYHAALPYRGAKGFIPLVNS